MNRILETFIGPQSPWLGITPAHHTSLLTLSNWHCKALPVIDDTASSYVFITQARCQRSDQKFYLVHWQHQNERCAIATFFELDAALYWVEQQLPSVECRSIEYKPGAMAA